MTKRDLLRACDITLVVVSVLVLALVVLLINMHHTPLGGVHGKIGLLMLAIVIGHTIKRAKFLKK